ncbi:MAG: tRNA (guanosine(18)-2'-O)-methyltransferase TrmH [Calditrichia bacterium]
MVTERRKKKIEQVLSHKQPDLTVVFENIHDPHNVSAILRTCDAVGVLETYQIYTNTEFPKLGKKSSASAKKWIKQHKFKDYHELKTALKEKNYSIYATCLDPDAISIYEVDWTKPAAIVMGNEHAGVTEEMKTIADKKVYIPQVGLVQSLNVSVATAVILYEAFRQRWESGLYNKISLPEEKYNELLTKWLDNKPLE